MAKGVPTQEQLKTTEQLSKLMSDMAGIAEKLEDSFEGQVRATKQMADNMAKMSTSDVVTQLTQVNETLKQVVDVLEKISKSSEATFSLLSSQAEAAGKATQSLEGKLKDASKALDSIDDDPLVDLTKTLMKTDRGALTLKQKLKAVGDYLKDKFPIAAAAAAGALSGLKQGFDNLMAIGSGILGFLGKLVDIAFSIASAIIAIPFKVFNGLVDMADKGGNSISELSTAINNVRKEFGALSGPVAKTITSTAVSMNGLAGSGVNAFAVFGTVAERMEQLNKLFVSGGAALQLFTKEFNENGGALLGYQKGLGLTDEQMGMVAQNAKAMGTPLSKMLNDITKQSLDLGKAFGIDAKIISKDMGKALQDVKHFATLSAKEIGVAATYARKLGVELDKITGLLDAFETFDSAAENVSKLNEAFGTNIDAAKLMNASSPAEQLEMLRKQFRAAGVDGEKLSRAQLKLISQNTNLDEGTLKLALSSKNAGVSMDSIRKQADKSEKKTMSQAEAMSKLADSMDRMLKPGHEMGGFFDSFIKGFTDGLQRTQEFRNLMMDIKKSLMAVYQEGVRLGKAFVEFFPGVKDVLKGFDDFFKPEKFKGLAKGVTDIFIQWFKDLSDPNGKASFSGLMDKLKDKFFEFFDKESSSGSKLLSGLSKFFEAFKVILAGAAQWIMESIAGFIKTIVSAISDPLSVSGVGGMAKAAENYLSPVAEALKNGWKVLGPALSDLFDVLMDKIGVYLLPKIEKYAPTIMGAAAVILFGPAFAQAALGAVTAAMGQVFIKGIAMAATNAAASGKLGPSLQKLVTPPQASAGATESIPDMDPKKVKSLQAMEIKLDWPTIGRFLAGFAAVMVIGLAAFLLAVAAIKAFNISVTETIQAVGIMLAVGFAALEISGVLFLLSRAPDPDKKLIPKLVGLGLITAGLALLGVAIAYMAKGLDIMDVVKGMGIVLAMSLALLVLSGALIGVAFAGELAKNLGVSILTGLVILGLIIAGLVVVGIAIADAAKGLTVTQLTQGLLLIALAISAIVAAMIALGAMIVAGAAGVWGGALALLGGGIITTVIEYLMTTAKKVTDAAAVLPVDIVPKAQVLIDVIKALAEIMKIIPSTLGALKLGNSDDVQKIQKVNELVSTMFGKPGGGGLIGLVEKIIAAVNAIGASNRMLEAAKSLAGVLIAAAELMKAVTPSPDVLKAVAEASGESTVKTLDAMKEYADNNFKKLLELIPAVQGFLTNPSVLSLRAPNLTAIETIGKFMSGLPAILQAMTPSQGMSDLLKEVSQHVGENTVATTEKLKEYTTGLTKALTGEGSQKGLIDVIADAVSTMFKAVGGVHFSEADAKALGAVMPAIVIAMEILRGIALNVVNAVSTGADPGKIKKALDDIKDSLPGVFESMAKSLPKMINGIGSVLDQVKALPKSQMDNVVGIIKGALEFINAIVSTLAAAPKVDTTQGKRFDEFNLAVDMDRIATFLWRIAEVGVGGDFAGDPPLRRIASYLNNPSLDSFKGLGPRINALKDVFGLLATIGKTIEDISPVDFKDPGKVGEHSPALEKIYQMADFIQSLLGGGPSGYNALTTISGAIKDNASKIQDLASNLPKLSSLSSSLDTLKAFLTGDKGVGGLSGAKFEAGNEEEGGILHTLVQISKLFSGAFSEGSKPLTTITTTIANNKKTIEDLVRASATITKVAGVIKSLMTTSLGITTAMGTEPAMPDLKKFKDFMLFMVQALESTGQNAPLLAHAAEIVQSTMTASVAKSIDGVEKMVTAGKRLADAMEMGNKIDIAAKLRSFSSMFGTNMGHSDRYTVKGTDVNVTVNLKVFMSAQELEGIILTKPGSIITNRINAMISAIPDTKEDESLKLPTDGSAPMMYSAPAKK